VHCFSYICPSVAYLSLTQYFNAVESSYFMVILLLALVNCEIILTWKQQRSRWLGTKNQKSFFYAYSVSLWKLVWFISNKYWNDLQLILHMYSTTFHQKRIIFWILFLVCSSKWSAENMPLFSLAWHTDSTPCILSTIAKNWGLLLKFFC